MLEQLHNGGISVRELIRTTALARATLRAGEGGLDREVRRVQWMEVLDDFADYLAPGDLLLTTAYNVRDDRRLQRELAARVAACGAAAMVVKCGYYLADVPYAVRAQADEVGLPVFEVAREVPFVELSQSIYERLVSRSYARLRRSSQIHAELVRLVVEGADLDTIVRRAAAMLGNPVVVEDEGGRRLAGAAADGSPWTPPAGGLAAVDSRAAAPVVSRGRVLGRVVLAAGAPPDEDDRQALEQVATTVALEIARSGQQRHAEAERVAALVRDLAAGDIGAHAARARAAALGIHLPDPARVVRLLIGDGEPPALGGPAAMDAEEVVTIVPADADLTAFGGIIAGGAGEPAALDALPRSYREAGRALTLGRALRGSGAVHRYADLEAYDTLAAALAGPGGAAARARTLDRLSPELARTLAAYLDSGASVAATAAALYVHRNTVHYRLRRIAALTGLDLGRLEDRLLCELGLLAQRLDGAV